MKSFRDAIVWQKGYELTLIIYEITAKLPRSEDFGLKSQLRRAAVSVISNFAEGFKRFNAREKVHFFRISEGSLEEIKCQLMLAKDLSYLDSMHYQRAEALAMEVGKLLSVWVKRNVFRP